MKPATPPVPNPESQIPQKDASPNTKLPLLRLPIASHKPRERQRAALRGFVFEIQIDATRSTLFTTPPP